MLFYRACLPLSRATLAYLGGVIRRYHRQIGSCWRKCNPEQQALLVLAQLRKGETFAELAAGSASAPPQAGGMCVRRWHCWRPGRRSWPRRRRPATRSWSSTARSSPSTAWRLTGRFIPASTAATA
jgi:hypothetical protein